MCAHDTPTAKLVSRRALQCAATLTMRRPWAPFPRVKPTAAKTAAPRTRVALSPGTRVGCGLAQKAGMMYAVFTADNGIVAAVPLPQNCVARATPAASIMKASLRLVSGTGSFLGSGYHNLGFYTRLVCNTLFLCSACLAKTIDWRFLREVVCRSEPLVSFVDCIFKKQ